MIQTVFSSDEFAPDRRLAAFDDFQVTSAHPMRVVSDGSQSFQATVRALDLGAADVVELTCSPAEVRRPLPLIRAQDPGLYSVVFPLCGRLVVDQAGRRAELGERELAVYDSRRPLRVRITAEERPARLVRAQVPRTLVAHPEQADRVLAVPLSGRSGVAALLTEYLLRLTTDSGTYRPADAPRLGGIAVDLLNAVIAHHAAIEPADGLPQRALLPRIEEYVWRHLHDPGMSPRSIAAAHHISVSHLHRLFQSQGIAVSSWIRRLRLERARRDLGDPALDAVPIHRIATRWGFNDHATFTRAFRAAYGIAPSDHRRRALESAPGRTA
ncbi:helix-turn-helix domain-containing protein [Spirillospora sp. NPDC000708]|uniref:helix-turn-helix domain-containing protein n=1 Tax=Actinomadura nitritigenes TaxID=134602 RepID=UPI00335F5DA3